MGIGEIAALIAAVLAVYLLCRMMLLPLKWTMKLLYNGVLGGLGLWVVNAVGGLVGITAPITVGTALVAGFLGLPGVVGIFVWYNLLVK